MTARAVREPDGVTLIETLHVPQGALARMRGLLGRDGLNESEGMLFEHCRLIHTFGMKFAIDLVYLDGQGRVRKAVEGLRPGRVSACLAADSVIELSSGAARAMGLRRGVTLRIVP